FTTTFARWGFRGDAFCPCYGLAEATLLVTGGGDDSTSKTLAADRRSLEQNRFISAAEENGDSRRLVCCGRPPTGCGIAIVDPHTVRICPPGQVGEIWVVGSHVATGYWNRPEDSALVFEARLADTGDGPFLRTGDLGFQNDGRLYVIGRLK